jgi:hypothetical protein
MTPPASPSPGSVRNKLDAAGVRYHYEEKFVGNDGKVRYPDYTIEDENTGRRYLWEHCGMLTDDAYRQRWEAKKAWYRTQGVMPREEGDGETATLIETRDSEEGGISAKSIKELIDDILK